MFFSGTNKKLKRSYSVGVSSAKIEWNIQQNNQVGTIHEFLRYSQNYIQLYEPIRSTFTCFWTTGSSKTTTRCQMIIYFGAEFHIWKGVVQSTERFCSVCENQPFSARTIYSGSCIPSNTWTNGRLHRFVTYGQTTYAAYPVVTDVAVAPHVDTDSMHQNILIKIPLILIIYNLLWWTRHHYIFKGMSIQSFILQVIVRTMGWAIHMNNKMVSGEWSETMQHHHINML